MQLRVAEIDLRGDDLRLAQQPRRQAQVEDSVLRAPDERQGSGVAPVDGHVAALAVDVDLVGGEVCELIATRADVEIGRAGQARQRAEVSGERLKPLKLNVGRASLNAESLALAIDSAARIDDTGIEARFQIVQSDERAAEGRVRRHALEGLALD